MINYRKTFVGKFLQTFSHSYQLTFILIGLIFSSQVLAQNIRTSDHSTYRLIIDDLVCRGNENTQCEFITKKYYQGVGDFVDPDEIADARLRLGTLQQFKNVTITLEKAKQRGHVNVVFLVDEAQHIQYSLRSSYRGGDNDSSHNDNFNQFVGVTDFNFLGSGKELSFGVGAYYSEIDSSSNFNIYNHGYNANLSYYDPHLNNSVNYFLAASINHSIYESSWLGRRIAANENISVVRGDNSSSITSYSVSLGRRFASHSYVSFGFSDNNKLEEASAFIAYGWDSTDDKLFATKGSAFRSKLSTSVDGDSSYLSLDYRSYTSLNENYVLGYQLSNVSFLKHPYLKENQFEPLMSISLSDIDSSQGVSGKYTGWRYHISSPLKDIDTNTLTFGLNYTYQTDSLIMDFSLSYRPDFGGE